MTNKPKTDLILWSGGFDSTYYILKTINEMKNLNSKQPLKTINTLSINSVILTNSKFQKEARKNISNIIDKKYSPNIIFQNDELEIPAYLYNREYGILLQPLLVYHIAMYIHDNTNVIICFVKGDAAIYYKNELLNVFNSICYMAGKHNCSLSFPLMLEEKYKMYAYFKDYLDPKNEILPLIYTCDNIQKKKNCGTCNKCIELDMCDFYYQKYRLNLKQLNCSNTGNKKKKNKK